MAALDFPASPSTNDIHTENGVSWKWNGSAWTRLGDVGAQGAQGVQGAAGTNANADKIEEGNSYAEVLDTGSNGIFRFFIL